MLSTTHINDGYICRRWQWASMGKVNREGSQIASFRDCLQFITIDGKHLLNYTSLLLAHVQKVWYIYEEATLNIYVDIKKILWIFYINQENIFIGGKCTVYAEMTGIGSGVLYWEAWIIRWVLQQENNKCNS